jgi:hypothetical protein
MRPVALNFESQNEDIWALAKVRSWSRNADPVVLKRGQRLAGQVNTMFILSRIQTD